MTAAYTNLLQRFLRYAAVDTQSDSESNSVPSTDGQTALLTMLAEELRTLGVCADSSKHCVMAHIPANVNYHVPPIGFIAHVDTSPDASGRSVKPQVTERYNGGDILLCPEEGIVLSSDEFPELAHYKGQTIITSDGTTLLGADDKAGVAEIMTLAEELARSADPHGKVCIAFTSDEEIGRGVDHFDVERFGAQYAYTIDGGAIGELEYENFNAALAKVTIKGRNIHPGHAKGQMRNALCCAVEFVSLLPQAERPEYTDGYEGFYHVIRCGGSVEESSLHILIRDHDDERFARRKQFLEQCAFLLNSKYGGDTVAVDITEQYRNMKSRIEPCFHIVETAMEAMRRAGVEPKCIPIRGGTDGARLSFMNLPCPNIFAGGHNFHSRYEYIPLLSMEKAVDTMKNITKIYAEHRN